MNAAVPWRRSARRGSVPAKWPSLETQSAFALCGQAPCDLAAPVGTASRHAEHLRSPIRGGLGKRAVKECLRLFRHSDSVHDPRSRLGTTIASVLPADRDNIADQPRSKFGIGSGCGGFRFRKVLLFCRYGGVRVDFLDDDCRSQPARAFVLAQRLPTRGTGRPCSHWS
jgi:hypothetical protein